MDASPPPDTGLFADDAVVRRVDGEAILLLGGPRALLMQLAHPLVARGVAEHSDFAADPFARLQRTLDATYTIVFGTEAEARHTAAVITAVHHSVTGPGYAAMDPELLMWVHATLVDTAMRVHRRFFGGLSAADAERYYEESTLVAELLGVPRAAQPEDLAAFRRYVAHMVDTLEVSDQARTLAYDVLHPKLPRVTAPVMEVARQLTAGLLPRQLREAYGFTWDRQRKALFAAAGLASRTVVPRIPGRLRRVA
jgi:uncharacterized protein (DUF2236 family)